MTSIYEVITFDCYGTLIDWRGGISQAFLAEAHAADVADELELDAERVLGIYYEVEPQVQAAAFQPYRAVLAETAMRTAEFLGWEMSIEAAERFAASLPGWPPFADTNAALVRLANAGYALGILSNVDDDLLAGTLQHFSVPFELIVTARQVQSYKPAHGHFVAAREHIGGRRWLHAAQSLFHDVQPCTELSIPVAWVNRLDEARTAGDPQPLKTVPTLAALADWLEV